MTRTAPVVERLSASIGVSLSGIDLRDPISDGDRDVVRSAIAEHHVVFFRGQHLNPDQHLALAEAFGPIGSSPIQLLAAAGRTVRPSISTIEDTVDRPPAGFPWHTDLSWTRTPPRLGFLSAVTIPAYGGDTLWASTAAVYERLDPAERARCDTLSVVHAPDESLLRSVARHHGTELADRLRAEHPGVEHPLVRTHPSTGRRSLFLSPLYATRIVGPAGADGALLARLHGMLDDPHVQVRWRWHSGDIAIWDEASTCHRALTDHHPQRRVMRRCVTV